MPAPTVRPRRPRLILVLGAALALAGCGVLSVAGAAAGAAISVAGSVVSTGVEVTGKVIGAGVDAVTGGGDKAPGALGFDDAPAGPAEGPPGWPDGPARPAAP